MQELDHKYDIRVDLSAPNDLIHAGAKPYVRYEGGSIGSQ